MTLFFDHIQLYRAGVLLMAAWDKQSLRTSAISSGTNGYHTRQRVFQRLSYQTCVFLTAIIPGMPFFYDYHTYQVCAFLTVTPDMHAFFQRLCLSYLPGECFLYAQRARWTSPPPQKYITKTYNPAVGKKIRSRAPRQSNQRPPRCKQEFSREV